jgi:hypothetical protein
MLSEVPEAEAGGEVAEIYDQIRRLWAVPYVSSLQRHLASRPGWLEWSWTALAPAFTSGRAQVLAWEVAGGLTLPELPPLTMPVARQLGVDCDSRRVIEDICAGFVRVAPVNLIFAGLLRRLLAGERPSGAGWPQAGPELPPPLPAPPAMVDANGLEDDARAVLLQLGTDAGGTLFVPGNYRMLARWPLFTAYLATVLPPMLKVPEIAVARADLLARIDLSVTDIWRDLPALPAAPPMPPETDFPAVLAALDTYRRTSPEMVFVNRMIAMALPAGD